MQNAKCRMQNCWRYNWPKETIFSSPLQGEMSRSDRGVNVCHSEWSEESFNQCGVWRVECGVEGHFVPIVAPSVTLCVPPSPEGEGNWRNLNVCHSEWSEESLKLRNHTTKPTKKDSTEIGLIMQGMTEWERMKTAKVFKKIMVLNGGGKKTFIF